MYRLTGSVFMTPYAYYSPKYKPAKENAPIIMEAMKFYHDKLGMNDYARIILKPFRENNNKQGYKEHGYITKELTIYLDPRFPISRMLLTLAHECVHYIQLQNGNLDYRPNDRRVFWKSQEWNLDEVSKLPVIEYMELPWEIEANQKQNSLYFAFTQYAAKHLNFHEKLDIVSEPI